MLYILFTFVLSYLLGSIPFGLILCRFAGYGDIREIGSGNIGATNVLRTGNKFLALATLILDSGKGIFAVVAIYSLMKMNVLDINNVAHLGLNIYAMLYISVLGAIIGHCFPVWLKFKGGKGVATTFGGLLAAAPVIGFICCLIWLISSLIARISSLSALTALFVAPFAVYILYGDFWRVSVMAAISCIVWVKHHENIKRILKGEEPKIGQKKS